MRQVFESVTLPAPLPQESTLRGWIGYLTPVLGAFGWRINRSLPKDGSERMTNPLPLAVYTMATRPNPVDWPGGVILVSDGPGPNKFQGSDGTSWIALG